MTLAMRDLDNHARGKAEGIEEGIEIGIERGVTKGHLEMLVKLVRTGVISVKEAADAYNVSEEEFALLIK